MAKFEVFFVETNYGFVEIEAESKSEAKEKGYEAYYNGMVYWNECELEITNIKIIK